jgi:hypothetical protein
MPSSDFDFGGCRRELSVFAGGCAVARKTTLHDGHLTFFPISSSGISNMRLQVGHFVLIGMARKPRWR